MKLKQSFYLTLFQLALATLGTASSISAEVLSDKSVDNGRLETTPDLMQSTPAAALPEGGLSYCGPVAVSNSFVWLAHNGYPKLGLLGGADSVPRQGRLARKLGEYMSSGNGTSPSAFLVGLSRFVLDRGYSIESLKYEGWEDHPNEFSKGVLKPNLNWIKTGLDRNAAVWLMIGWYNYSKKQDEYTPCAQHWVTVVGFGQDKQGKKDPNILIVHDPAPRSGPIKSHDYVKMELIKHGTFTDGCGRKELSAVGWYKMSGDLKIKKGAEYGVLDGAVVLRLNKPDS